MAYHLEQETLINDAKDAFLALAPIDELSRKCVLEIGGGTGVRSIPLARYFNKYHVLEPDKVLYNRLVDNCVTFESNIIDHNVRLSDFDQKDMLFDVVICINSFHFLDFQHDYERIMKMLAPNGILYIQEKKPEPHGWGDNKLNRSSHLFNVKSWNQKVRDLDKVNTFLMEKNATRYEYNSRYIYIITK